MKLKETKEQIDPKELEAQVQFLMRYGYAREEAETQAERSRKRPFGTGKIRQTDAEPAALCSVKLQSLQGAATPN